MSHSGKIKEIEKMDVAVGIVAATHIDFSLSGAFITPDGEYVEGTQHVAVDDNAISWRGKQYVNLLFYPSSATCTFEISDVVIGIDFHWQRKEKQRFQGALRLVIEAGKIRVINDINIEKYLLSVISSEMNADSPLELLKAHAVISRSWVVSQILGKGTTPATLPIDTRAEVIKWFDRDDHEGFDVCADDHCQRYQGVTRTSNSRVATAIEATRGMVLIDSDGSLCDARFSKCCGGATELFSTCWDDHDPGYLPARRDTAAEDAPALDLTTEHGARQWIMSRPQSFCNTSCIDILTTVLNSYDCETPDFYRWKVTYSASTLAELLARRSGRDIGRIKALVPLKRGPSGRISLLKVEGELGSVTVGKELMIRRWLSESHLYSSAFIVDASGQDADGFPTLFTLHGAGWGHGVGLCQIGAAVMAAEGWSHDAILAHYFPGTTLSSHLCNR